MNQEVLITQADPLIGKLQNPYAWYRAGFAGGVNLSEGAEIAKGCKKANKWDKQHPNRIVAIDGQQVIGDPKDVRRERHYKYLVGDRIKVEPIEKPESPHGDRPKEEYWEEYDKFAIALKSWESKKWRIA